MPDYINQVCRDFQRKWMDVEDDDKESDKIVKWLRNDRDEARAERDALRAKVAQLESYIARNSTDDSELL
jgi:hypothetical protein